MEAQPPLAGPFALRDRDGRPFQVRPEGVAAQAVERTKQLWRLGRLLQNRHPPPLADELLQEAV